MPTLKPAAVFHAAEIIADLAIERGWTLRDFAERVGALDQPLEVLSWTFYAVAASAEDVDMRVGMRMGEDSAMDLERVFGISAEFWRNTEAVWRENPDAHQPLSADAFAWYDLDGPADLIAQDHD